MSDRNAYNRSSLALDYENRRSPNAQPRSPELLKRSPANGRVLPMFRGLDQQIATRGRGTTVLSVSAHCAIIAAVLWLAAEIRNPIVTKAETILPITLFAPAPPPPVMHVAKLQGGGGGSGAHHPAPPPPKPLPQVAKTPVILEKVSRIVDPPKLPVEPTVQINIAQKNPMPSFGMPDSPQVAMASQGSGSQNGFGVGMGGGLGAGHGVGQGPGSRAGYGGGVMNVGNGVSTPQVIHSVEPQFTPEARQANYTGTVGIQLIVDSNGDPQDVRVVRHLGMGLDEEAIAAVKQYRFRPAVYDGHPVSVQMIIDVDFRLH